MKRSADIIKHEAYRVSASEVEAVLQDHPTVIGAPVVGVPDPKVGGGSRRSWCSRRTSAAWGAPT